ncbi:MAG: HAD hydrolase-like protein [Bacteroidota bacterium]
MDTQTYLDQNDAFIFELDNVVYPEKDFYLQVYYLFSHFLEYSEQISAIEVLGFMKNELSKNGPEGVFRSTTEKFKDAEKYKLNYEMLLSGAKLPLKLEMFPEIFSFLKKIISRDKQIFLLTKGDPAAQLNKIKQTNWNGIADRLTVYFSEEIAHNPADMGLPKVLCSYNLEVSKTVFIGRCEQDLQAAEIAGINYLTASKLLV